MTPASGRSQNDSASSRGNAIRRLPIMSGTKKCPNGPRMMLETIMIIMAPCRPTIVRYWPGENTGEFGCRSSVRISIAFRPPMKKKIPIPIRYWLPITLWSVLAHR